MTSAAFTADDSSANLSFAQSESKAVGFSGKAINVIRDNAPRVVGVLKMSADVAGLFVLNPLMMAYSAFSITGRTILLLYGTKKNQQKLAEKVRQGDYEILGNSFRDGAKKMLRPRQYPVEASSGLSAVGEMFEAAYGASELSAGRPGLTPLIVGSIAVFSYGLALFGKEKKKDAQKESSEPLVFAQSKSKPVGMAGNLWNKMKGNPVLISSVIGIAMSIGLVTGSLMEGMNAPYLIYSFLALTSYVVQAMFVRKNEFNIEGAQAEAQQKPLTFEEKLAQKRQQENNLGAKA